MDYIFIKVKKYSFGISVFLICVLYLVLRLSYPETIEFGYDQPRLATKIVEYIQNGKVFETQKFAEKAPWGNISWGPALFYFYAPFFLVTKDPLLISQLLGIFNLLSIVLVIYIGSKYLSRKAGLVAGLFLATQPWWFIFSRMIYQPTPIITLILVSIFLFFKTINNPKSLYVSFLIFSWLFLTEIYFHTISFVLISAITILYILRNRFFTKYFFFGICISSILIIPFFINFTKTDYLPDTNQQNTINKYIDIPLGFIKTISGSSMEYQLGYGFEDFNNKNPLFKYLTPIFYSLTILLFVYHGVRLFLDKKTKFIRLIFLFWTFCTLLFLLFIPLPNVPPIPRYFLISLPGLSILYGLCFSEIYAKSKIVLSILIVPLVWILFIFSYNKFIFSYNFPQGHLSVYSDTQYMFLYNAIKNTNYRISNDENRPKEFSWDWATKYILTYVLRNGDQKEDKSFYLIDYSIDKSSNNFIKIGRFGPYSLYKYLDL